MRTFGSQRHYCRVVTFVVLLVCFASQEHALSAPPGRSVIPQLQEQFGLSESQVELALGALLVFARDRLPEPDFDDLALRIPNADYVMQNVKSRGVVTRPLDDIDDYEESLASIGIGQPMASQFAPAVIQYLGSAGWDRERDILARVVR